ARQLSAGAGLAATAGFGTGGRVCRRNPGRSGDRRAGRLAASSRDAPAPAARTCISLRSGCFGRRARVGLGWPPPGYDGQAVPPLLLNTGAKNLYEQKTRGELMIFSFFDLLQQPVMPMISIHIFARGKRPWTRTTGANTNKES